MIDLYCNNCHRVTYAAITKEQLAKSIEKFNGPFCGHCGAKAQVIPDPPDSGDTDERRPKTQTGS
jgi:hypothetical protein